MSAIVRFVLFDVLLQRGVDVAVDDQRKAFGVEEMIGRGGAEAIVRFGEEAKDVVAVIELEDDGILLRQRAANLDCELRWRRGVRHARRRVRLRVKKLFRARHERDVAIVRFAPIGAPRDQAMIHQHDPFGVGLFVEAVGNVAAQRETGTLVRDDDHGASEAFAYGRLAAARVGDGEDGVGVRVQHGVRGKKRVKQCFDRRSRAGGIDETSRQVIDHRFIAHVVFALTERCNVVESYGRKLFRHDRLHVAAAALDEHHRHAIVEKIAGLRLHAVVAAAPQHQRLFRSDETRLIDELLDVV